MSRLFAYFWLLALLIAGPGLGALASPAPGPKLPGDSSGPPVSHSLSSTWEVTGTAEHPYWSGDRGAWVVAGDLKVGERLLSASGDTATVVKSERLTPSKPVTVFNLEVADWHTYFVGDGKTSGVWVHNACSSRALKRFSRAAKTTAAPTGQFYSTAFETTLSPTSYPGISRYMHFKEANTALDAAIRADAGVAASMEQLGVSIPRSSSGSILGKSPEGWVWHHDTQAGVMQLVPKSQHPNIPGGIFWETMHPGGNGGFSIWGK